MSGVICDRRVRVPDRGKMYEMVVRPAKIYSLETVALIKKTGAAGGGRIEDAMILIRSDKEGHDKKLLDSIGPGLEMKQDTRLR